MSGERIVFLGNCQAYALYHVYGRYVAPSREQIVRYVNAQALPVADPRGSLEKADVVVVQQFDFASKVTADTLRPGVRRYTFPMVTGAWLWPHGGQAHPQTRALPYLSSGPYPAELGDRFLNRMILEGVGDTEALDRYLSSNIVSTTNIDRLLDMQLRRQRTRDRQTGFDLTSVIEANIHERRLFLTMNHYNLLLFKAVALGVFGQLGLSETESEDVLSRLRATPFPKVETPLHPAVACHYRIPDAGIEERYVFLSEGSFTFAQYVRRYMRHQWNSDLQEGLHRSGAPDPRVALELLEKGLAVTPDSWEGLRAKAGLLARVGRHEEADATIRQAIALKPEDPESYVAQARALLDRGDNLAAEAAARRAVQVNREHSASHCVLSEVLLRQRRSEEAVAAAKDAVSLVPGDASNQLHYGHALVRCGDISNAIKAYRHAERCDLAPSVALPPLVDALLADGQQNEAIRLLQAALQDAPDDPILHTRLSRAFAAAGDLDSAEGCLRRSLELDPERGATHLELAALLARRERWAEAIAVCRKAIQFSPTNSHLHSALGHYILRTGDTQQAEACFWRALQLEPATVEFRRQLISLLLKSNKLSDAQDLLDQGLALQPQDCELSALAADLMERKGSPANEPGSPRQAPETTAPPVKRPVRSKGRLPPYDKLAKIFRAGVQLACAAIRLN